MKTSFKAFLLVVLATITISISQTLIKLGVKTLTWNITGIITNHYIIIAYMLLAVSSVLVILGFKWGELSVLYPVIGLSFVWVLLISFFFLGETVNAWKIIGSAFIVGGVALLGAKTKK